MSVYVGIDVHRKRSQVAVVTEDGTGAAEQERGQRDGDDPAADRRSALGDAGGVRGRVRLGLAGPSCWRTTASTRTWCTRCGARRSPRRG